MVDFRKYRLFGGIFGGLAFCDALECRKAEPRSDNPVSYTHLMSEAVAAYRDKYAASEYSSSQKSDDVTGAGASAYTTNVSGNVSAYSRSDKMCIRDRRTCALPNHM